MRIPTIITAHISNGKTSGLARKRKPSFHLQLLAPLHCTAPLSDLLVNPWLNKSKRVFSPGGTQTHTTREIIFSSLLLYQLSYRGLMLGETIFLLYILIPIFLIIFYHYLIFLERRPSWKGQ